MSSGKLAKLVSKGEAHLIEKREVFNQEIKHTIWKYRQADKAQPLSKFMSRQIFDKFKSFPTGASKNLMSPAGN